MVFASSEVLGDGPIRFNRDIRPILSDLCFQCHGPDRATREADLRLDDRQAAVESAIVPGDAAASEVLRRITSEDPEERMPPANSNKRPLSATEVELVRRWIDQGASYELHWSLIPPTRPAIPAAVDMTWTRDPIDAFILARLRSGSLSPSPDADAVTLLRRLNFDLLGLPPDASDPLTLSSPLSPSPPHDLAGGNVEHDITSPDQYERYVDRLLASPHFGERMASYWLDLVRYADTVGYHGDQEHHISPYRDYVIDAFNQNLPFDQFTKEQLAGDLLPNPTVEQIVATGYNRVLQTSHEGGVQAKEYLAKYSADRVRNLGEVWLGLTTGCAECHDHKFDPVSQRDFYRLAAYFADIEEKGDFKGAGDTTPTKRPPEMDVLWRPDRDELESVRSRIAAIEVELGASSVAQGSGGANSAGSAPSNPALVAQLEALRARAAELESRKRRTMITRSAQPRDIRVLARGNWMDESGEIVLPGTPAALGGASSADRRLTRLDLAEWLTRPDHPLTSRVVVNRLWYLFTGVGISKVLDDLGSQGEWPTHPELLDWLAVEFLARDWDVKAMVRAIVTSAVYRQSSLETPDLRKRDPENRLFARQSRPRLSAEMIRDNALATSGLLVLEVGGRSARPYQPAGYYQHLNFPKREYEPDHGRWLYRRSLYTHWQRQYLHPTMKAFDAPSREECTAQRPINNTPAGALALLNDPQFVEAARVFAERILREGGDDAIAWAWRGAVTREITDDEREVLSRLLASHREYYRANPREAESLISIGEWPVAKDADAAELAAWTSVARVLFNLDETITRN